MTVELLITSASKVRLFKLTGDPRAHNLDGEVIKVQETDLPASVAGPSLKIDAQTGGDARGLPPASTFLYVFEGVQFAEKTD